MRGKGRSIEKEDRVRQVRQLQLTRQDRTREWAGRRRRTIGEGGGGQQGEEEEENRGRRGRKIGEGGVKGGLLSAFILALQ